ncbi:MAG: EamA family transporter, partial [Alphaproteobacteria bacterium]|nr:EamA family transporter [Alphaproteobacteria bacterium]
WLFYGAQTYIPSAFAAVIFSSVILVNALNTRIWRKEPTSKGVIIGGIMGIGGLSLVFLPALSNLALDNGVVLGLGLGILGTFTASIGNVAAANLKDLGGKLVLTNAWGMLIGGCVTLSVHALLGGEWVFPTDAGYWLPLVYLVTVSSIIGFGSYLSLIGRLGPARAASTSVVFPLVAFVPSIVFEGVAVSTELVIGVALVLGGNTLVLWERHRANRKNTPRQRD